MAKVSVKTKEFRDLMRGNPKASAVRAVLAKAKKLPVEDIVSQLAFADAARDPEVARVLIDALFARPEDCAAIAFNRAHLAAITGNAEWLEGTTSDDLETFPNVWHLTKSALLLATERGHIELVRALLARGTSTTWRDERALDLAVENGHEALVELFLGHGDKPTTYTASRVRSRLSDDALDRLIAAGMDLADPESGLVGWVGIEKLDPEPCAAYLRRLMARGLRLDMAGVREILDAAYDDARSTNDLAVTLFDLAREAGTFAVDAELVTYAIDALPLAAVQRLAELGATIRPTTRVKSTAPEAAAKRAWLAKRTDEPAAPGRIGWEDFARLDGADLSVATVCERLVGDTVLPELALGVAPDTLPIGDFLGEDINDEDLPATHGLEISTDDDNRVSALEYTLKFWMEGKNGGVLGIYKEHGKTAYDALAGAITKLHGKPRKSGKSRYWDVPERQIALEQHTYNSDYRPHVEIRVRVSRPDE